MIERAATMRAAVVETIDGVFKTSEIARPVPRAGEALVRIHASGVNPLDTKIRAGKAAHARHSFPAILGIDLAGVVTAVGAGVTTIAPGDEVFGMTGGVGGVQGSLAQYAAVDVRLIARKPENLTMREAAALPLAVITAWEGLIDRGRVTQGQRVLVQGGAGGVGHVAVQLAQARGAIVFATGRADDLETIRRLGATPIDYSSSTVEDYVARHTDGQGFDLVFDTVGGPSLDASFQAIRRFGQVVSALGWGTHALAPLSFKGGTYSGVFTLLPLLTGVGREHHGDILREAGRLAEQGRLVPILNGRRFGLNDAGEAHALVSEGRAKGKVVIEMEP